MKTTDSLIKNFCSEFNNQLHTSNLRARAHKNKMGAEFIVISETGVSEITILLAWGYNEKYLQDLRSWGWGGLYKVEGLKPSVIKELESSFITNYSCLDWELKYFQKTGFWAECTDYNPNNSGISVFEGLLDIHFDGTGIVRFLDFSVEDTEILHKKLGFLPHKLMGLEMACFHFTGHGSWSIDHNWDDGLDANLNQTRINGSEITKIIKDLELGLSWKGSIDYSLNSHNCSRTVEGLVWAPSFKIAKLILEEFCIEKFPVKEYSR